jgi:hypothetical protein
MNKYTVTINWKDGSITKRTIMQKTIPDVLKFLDNAQLYAYSVFDIMQSIEIILVD